MGRLARPAVEDSGSEASESSPLSGGFITLQRKSRLYPVVYLSRVLVRAAFLAACRRDVLLRFRAAPRTCRDKEACEAAPCPSRRKAALVARERRDEDLRRVRPLARS